MSHCSSNSYKCLNYICVTVWVDVIESLFKSSVEELATCGFFIMGAGIIPITKCCWVYEVMLNEVVYCASEYAVSSEIYNSISDEHSSQFYFFCQVGC